MSNAKGTAHGVHEGARGDHGDACIGLHWLYQGAGNMVIRRYHHAKDWVV